MKFNKKMLLTILLLLAGVGVLSGGIYYTWLITPPEPPKTAAEGMKTIGSARFARMPDYRKIAYVEQTWKLMSKLPEDQRRNLFHEMRNDESARKGMEQARMVMMTQEVTNFAKATPEDRIKILDAAIDREEQMRSMWAGRRGGPGGPGGLGGGANAGAQRPDGPRGQGGPPGGGRGPGPGNFRARMHQFIQYGNPQVAGLMAEFRRAMHERRAQRGLSDHPHR